MATAQEVVEEMTRRYDRELQDLRAQLQQITVNPSSKMLEAVFSVSAIADNTATNLFRIETTNESGSNDAGTYAVYMHLLITHAAGATSGNNAAKSLTAHYVRAIKNDGAVGVNSAVSEISETASAATSSASRDISTVTVTVQENSEYQNDIQITVDLTGTGVNTAHVICYVRVLWQGFNTAPQLSAL